MASVKQQLLDNGLKPAQIKQMFGDLRMKANKVQAERWLEANVGSKGEREPEPEQKREQKAKTSQRWTRAAVDMELLEHRLMLEGKSGQWRIVDMDNSELVLLEVRTLAEVVDGIVEARAARGRYNAHKYRTYSAQAHCDRQAREAREETKESLIARMIARGRTRSEALAMIHMIDELTKAGNHVKADRLRANAMG